MQYSHHQVFLKENPSMQACSEHHTLYLKQPIQLPTSLRRTGNVELVGTAEKKWKSSGSSASEEILVFLLPGVVMPLVAHRNSGCKYLRTEHNNRGFLLFFIPFPADFVRQRDSDSTESGSEGWFGDSNFTPMQFLICRTLLGIAWHGMVWHSPAQHGMAQHGVS